MTTDQTIISSIDNIREDEDKSPYLTFVSGPRLGQIFALDKEEITVGRSPECDLWIEDIAISRKHFILRVKVNQVRLEDLDSTNGTYVNGDRVKGVKLSDGDKIQISKTTILELTYLDKTRSLSEKKRYEMGVIDPVTNVYNKRYLLERLREEFSFVKRRNRDMSIIMFDLDHFKKINDTYGHLAGDLVLQKVCLKVSQAVRTDDILARYGGEEFVIVMRDAGLKEARDLAERIRRLVGDLKIRHEDHEITLTISCGLSSMRPEFKDHLAIIAEADRHLYESKKEGRNRVTGPGK